MRKCSMFLALAICFGILMMAMGDVAEAASKKYRLGAHYPAGYFVNNGFRRVAERVLKETNGEIEIVLYESSALGSYEQVFQEVMRGTIDGVTNYPTSRFNKKFELVCTPSLAIGYDEIEKMLKRGSPFYNYVASVYEECGVVYIGSFVDTTLGACIRKGKTITNPYDDTNKQCQMRTLPLATARKWWGAMGYQLATVPYAEVFTSLQTGVIDGDMGSGPEGAYLAFGDVMGMYIEYPNQFVPLDFVMSKKAWDSFTDEQKDIILKAYEAEAEIVSKEAREGYNKYLQIMKDNGIQVVTPTAENIKFMNEIAYKHSWPETAKYTGMEILDEIKAYLGN